jgi:hypothetical protein
VARRTSNTSPERPEHSPEQKRQDIARLQRRIAELEAFNPSTLTRRDDPKIAKLETAILDTLSHVFGEGTQEFHRYWNASRLDDGPYSIEPDWIEARQGGGYRDEAAEAQRYVTEGVEKSLSLLNQAISSLEEEIEFASATPIEAVASVRSSPSRKIFIVHGHDNEAKSEVARFLSKIGLEEIILHERPNGGRHLLTKFQDESEGANFAVVLMTPDDTGAAIGHEPQHRARQNVVFELEPDSKVHQA